MDPYTNGNPRYRNKAHEGHSEQHLDGLRERVSMLKEISIGIGDELDEQRRFLTTFDDDLNNTGGMLAGTMQQFKRMAATQNGCMLLWFCVFVLGVFSYMYLYVKYWR